jgi:hypothetical protein
MLLTPQPWKAQVMAEFNRGVAPPIPPPPYGTQPPLELSGPRGGFQLGADGSVDPLNVADLPVPRQERGRGGRQPTLSGAES